MTKKKKYTTPDITCKRVDEGELFEWIWNGIAESEINIMHDIMTGGRDIQLVDFDPHTIGSEDE
jgi:hypothetical protein